MPQPRSSQISLSDTLSIWGQSRVNFRPLLAEVSLKLEGQV